jgi:hypothetical protein
MLEILSVSYVRWATKPSCLYIRIPPSMEPGLCKLSRISVPRNSVNEPSLDAPSFFGWHHGSARTT